VSRHSLPRFYLYTLEHKLLISITSEAFKTIVRVADDVGCRCVITDAYCDKAGLCARYGFIPVEGAEQGGPQKMFLDIRTIRAALQQGKQ
jgi:hypothetical protein